MALRKTPLVNGEVYHVFNRSIRGMRIFNYHREINLFIKAIEFYIHKETPVKFSHYRKQKNLYSLKSDEKAVNIINFCLMPTHFHFTLKQVATNGIRQFIQRLTNSFAHYFNLRNKTRGPVFERNFKAVRVENDEQLLHLSRYIHLNPVTAYLVERPEDYPYSSYKVYLGKEKLEFVDPSLVMSNISVEDYRKFVMDQKDYQRELDRIKHLTFE